MANVLEEEAGFMFDRGFPADIEAELTDAVGRARWRVPLGWDRAEAERAAAAWQDETDFLIRAVRRAKTSGAPAASIRVGRFLRTIEALKAAQT